MIVLSRRRARAFRLVIRRCVASTDRRATDPVVVIRAGKFGVILSAVIGDVAVACIQPGQCAEDLLAVPSAALAEWEGTGDDVVRLERAGDGHGRASVGNAEPPDVRTFPVAPTEKLPPFPPLPEAQRRVEPAFLQILHDATRTAAKDAVKFALNRVLLRGKDGVVVGTDSKQMLVVRGLALPWPDGVLIPRVDVWDCLERADTDPITVGRTKDRVAVRAGPWTIVLKIDATGRFPPFEQILPGPRPGRTRLRLPPELAALVIRDVPRLPGRDGALSPVQLDLGKRPAIRGRAEDGRTVELPLDGATRDGPPVDVGCNRDALVRALKLGFREIHVAAADKPLFCRDDRRTYMWMPVTWTESPAPITAPRTSAAPACANAPTAIPNPQPKLENPSMAASPTNHRPTGDDAPPRPPGEEIGDPLAEVEAVRAILHEANTRLGRLVAALKEHRRQARAMRAAVQSLRQIPSLAP